MTTEREECTGTRHLFVMRDFQIQGVKIPLEYLIRTPPEGYDEVIVPGLEGSRIQGQIFDHAVRQELVGATHVLAVVDLPNANVGFEIGYALGLRKPIALTRYREKPPDWLQRPPLVGYLAPPARSTSELRDLIAEDQWIDPLPEPAKGERVLFLCPTSGPGETLRRVRDQAKPDWVVLPSSGWSLSGMIDELEGVGRIVWCIAPFAPGTDERDGQENTANAIVAGFAAASGIELHVLRQQSTRPVADLSQWEKTFDSLRRFEELIAEVDQPTGPKERVAPPPDSLPPGSPRPLPSRRQFFQALRERLKLVAMVVAAVIFAGFIGNQVYLESLPMPKKVDRILKGPRETVKAMRVDGPSSSEALIEATTELEKARQKIDELDPDKLQERPIYDELSALHRQIAQIADERGAKAVSEKNHRLAQELKPAPPD